jgi:hypothetical protein
MATIYKVIDAEVPAEFAWQAINDVGALHTRLVRGFVVETQCSGNTRTVTFANGMVVNEQIISSDEVRQRLAYTAIGGRASHYNASVQVRSVTNKRCEIHWIIDLLPDEMEQPITQMVEAGAAAMKTTLEQDFTASNRSI